MAEGALQRVMRIVEDQGTIISRLQLELENHVKDTSRPLQDFYRLVMDPETGLVVKHRHLERTVQQLDDTIADLLRPDPHGRTMGQRVKVLEMDLESRQGTRRWAWRDVVVPTILVILSSLFTAWFTYLMVS